MSVLAFFSIFILTLGILENYFHQQRIKKIPIRIHVNGIRGKSTTVRLIAATLREAGYQVLAKTTGTTPRIILENGEEESIKRRGPANIIEQKHFIKKAVKRGSNAIVMECMAVHPETQWVSEHKMIKSTIGVITNVRKDHQDVYGTDLQDIADSLKLTIPRNGLLVTAEQKFFPLFQKQTQILNTQCILAEPDKIALTENNESENIFFKDNVAITLQVGKILNIKEELCWQGILKAKPDPGALSIYQLKMENKLLWFVNAFAANDRESIMLIWNKVNQLLPKDLINSPKIAMVNNRGDRVTRTIQFAKILSWDIVVNYIFLAGPTSPISYRKLIQNGYPSKQIKIVKDKAKIKQTVEQIFQLTKKEGVVYGLGNTRGLGLAIIEYLTEKGEKI
ncbi:MAG: Capsule biosynthesis protein CapB [candidate division TA06 bacterium 34_109]|uniref:Capsule biosynthesis protein CapB n=1 Tax=candidate division TA06 bacterium 34_109 TaxID=1635277 RepID=A0A101I1G4_UNCT6|nr:MAG: Capsule biosynthesis protein CapB [candidate division TA06 bacterium 34_109]